ncbi:DUF3592 domain-containing protein [Streptacidiphilus carbonis]|uniref:DUF3592 domain-containing protein n=1 Tax=Streptacidiphilus carbonis TaxID=105422 RepID=UPI001379062C|nr:DUF3592 domain-containing protein [Streptacidiphilus carbonis]
MALGSIALLCGVTGVTVLVIAVRAVMQKVRTHRTLGRGLLTDGQVLHVYLVPGDQGRAGVRRSVVAFRTLDGGRFLVNDESGLPRGVGDRVPVRYPVERPQHAVLADVRRGVVGPVVFGLCAAGFATACLFACVWALTRSR